jgi:hypothetical protein
VMETGPEAEPEGLMVVSEGALIPASARPPASLGPWLDGARWVRHASVDGAPGPPLAVALSSLVIKKENHLEKGPEPEARD